MKWIIPLLTILYLSFNYDKGTLLVLSDGSRWKINEKDAEVTALWIVPVPIKIEKGTDETYPYILNNLQTKQKVKADKS
jgi:hypothetical protein